MGIAPEALADYRNAFAEFARKDQQARMLMATPNADPQAIDTALLELERARVAYNRRRDRLAQHLLNNPGTPAYGTTQPPAGRVSEVAELRWQLAGKPDGTADEDWYRAEEIVRQVTAA